MNRRLNGLVLLMVFALSVFVPVVNQAFGQDKGEPVVGADIGKKVDEEPMEEEGSSIWPWLLGIGAVVAAGVAGYLIANDDDDDDKAAPAAAAPAEAAAAAPAADAPKKYVVHITGTFRGMQAYTWRGGPSFTPWITFRVPYDEFPGGIYSYLKSNDGVSIGYGGDYEQVSDKSVMIRVDDSFYMGKATTISADVLHLYASDVNLKADPGAGIYLLATQQ